MSNTVVSLPPTIPTDENEAILLGRSGHWATVGTPCHLAEIQNREAALFHNTLVSASPSIDWGNAINGDMVKTVNLDLEDLRRQGVSGYFDKKEG